MTWHQRLSAFADTQRARNGNTPAGIAKTRTAIAAWIKANQPRRPWANTFTA